MWIVSYVLRLPHLIIVNKIWFWIYFFIIGCPYQVLPVVLNYMNRTWEKDLILHLAELVKEL